MTDTEQAEFIPEIVDSRAHIKPISAFDPADLARMSDVRRELFYSAHKALSECQEVEDAARQGDEAIRAAVADLGDKRAARDALVPVWSAFDEYKRLIKKIVPPEPSAEDKRAAELAQAQYETAEAELTALRQRVQLFHDAISDARKFAASQWARYHDKFKPKTAAEVHKEMLARDLDRKRNGTDKRQDQQFNPQCALDAYMYGGKLPTGMRSTRMASRGAYPSAMRGQRVAPPTPVDRRTFVVKPHGAA